MSIRNGEERYSTTPSPRPISVVPDSPQEEVAFRLPHNLPTDEASAATTRLLAQARNSQLASFRKLRTLQVNGVFWHAESATVIDQLSAIHFRALELYSTLSLNEKVEKSERAAAERNRAATERNRAATERNRVTAERQRAAAERLERERLQREREEMMELLNPRGQRNLDNFNQIEQNDRYVVNEAPALLGPGDVQMYQRNYNPPHQNADHGVNNANHPNLQRDSVNFGGPPIIQNPPIRNPPMLNNMQFQHPRNFNQRIPAPDININRFDYRIGNHQDIREVHPQGQRYPLNFRGRYQNQPLFQNNPPRLDNRNIPQPSVNNNFYHQL